MKAGILTFHSAHNYGAVLQAYASQEIIGKLGYDCEIIDYRPDYLIRQRVFPRPENRSFIVNMKIMAEGLLSIYWRFKRYRGFEKFMHKSLHLSAERFGPEKFRSDNNYDRFVMGSDQIWNIRLTKGFDDLYWGNFTTRDGAKKISYAASMSNYELDDIQKTRMTALLGNFSSIGVREEALRTFIHDLTDRQVTTVLDPVFLLDAAGWRKISKPPQRKRKYILMYCIDLRDDVNRIARKLAGEMDADVIELGMGVDRKAFSNPYQTADPAEFLGLFDQAEFVVTSSFHGTAFAVLFNKPFYSLAHGNDKDTRQRTVLNNLGIPDRFISRDASPEYSLISYGEVNNKLQQLREDSVNFLKTHLS